MNTTVYVPRDLEAKLKARAEAANLSPSLLIQAILREALSAEPDQFSPAFAALAGSWEDERRVDEILRDISGHRTSANRGALR